MTRLGNMPLAVLFVLSATAACAQPCPKVTYTSQQVTIRSLVTSVNCLVDSTASTKPGRADETKAGLLADSFPIIGPQHTRKYRKIVFAVLAVPTGDGTKTAAVTPDNAEASVSATAGAECKIKINPDKTVDGQCNLTGGTLYVVYHN